MVYETSYDSGGKPFLPDPQRGTWAKPSDFVYAGIGLAFKLDIFTVAWTMFFEMGVTAIIPYLICLALYVVPIVFMQSFMGQFSSSGFISAFRISPLFKGIGYISLAVNISIMTYYNIFAAVPLLFIGNSFRPTLPWSCDSFRQWSQNLTSDEKANFCNTTQIFASNFVEEVLDVDAANASSDEHIKEYIFYEMPSVIFFESHFEHMDFYNANSPNISFSYTLIFCTLLTWAIIAGIFYKFFDTAKLGQLIRYGILVTVGLLVLCLTRFAFLPGTSSALVDYFTPSLHKLGMNFMCVPLFVMSAFGAGWGSIVTLSSFNHFRTNIQLYSWVICLGQMLIFLGFGMASFLIERHFSEMIKLENFNTYVEHQWLIYLSAASAIAPLELANLWSILFYTMLFLAALIMMVTHLYSLLVSAFDEFEILRAHKRETIFGLIGCIAFLSLYFCSSQGLGAFTALSIDALFTQTALNLLVVIMMLWIYGRVRFQRDVEFMTSARFATWKVNMLRFVAPVLLAITIVVAIFIAVYEHIYAALAVQIGAIFLIALPWLFIPGYIAYFMLMSSGSVMMRFKRCCRPTDWYPYDADERSRYEESINNTDFTQQLNEIAEEVF